MTSLVSHSPAFGTPDYWASLDAAQGINQAAQHEVRRRGVMSAPAFGFAAVLAVMLGLFGSAALVNGVSIIPAPVPVEVTVIPAVDEVELERGGSVLVEVDAR